MEQTFVYTLPVWIVGLIFLAVLLGALETGYRVGLARRESWKDADSGGGGVVLTSLLAVLGLVLAFTYAAGVSRFDARKQAVILEANALGTAFLRADLVAEPGRSELRKALYEYARTRSIAAGTAVSEVEIKAVLDKSLRKQARLWPATRQVVAQKNAEAMEVSLVAAMNDVFDAHTIRLAAVADRLPIVVIWLLLLVAACALSVTGFNAGLQGIMSRWRVIAFTIVLTGIIVVILDLDRPNDGMVIVKQSSINQVVADMEAELTR